MIERITTDKKIPEILYKYRDWSNSFHRRLFTHQEVYFPSPMDFNDPFDGNIPVRWDLLTYEDCLHQNFEILKKGIVQSEANEQALRIYAKQVTDDKLLFHPDKVKRESVDKMKEWNLKIGLLSLSEVPDNILMWSHYAAEHKGVSIGFKTKILSEFPPLQYIEPITYSSKFPIISGLDETTLRFYKKFFYKSKLWEYEKEWRISINHIENRKVKFPIESIAELVIGCRANKDTKSDILRLAKTQYKEVAIYQAVIKDENFALDLERIH